MSSQHTTENLTIHHKVTDYTAWRKGYDAHEQNRRSAGITNGRVFRSAEDPNDVVVLQDVTDLAKARTFCGLGGCEGGDAKERRHRLAQRPLRDLSSEDHCSRDGSRHELLHYPCCETGTPPPAITAGGGVFRASRVATMWSHSYGPRWPDRPKRQPRISPSRSGGIKKHGKNMSYRISYDDGLAISVKKWRNEGLGRTETFQTEPEALNRARELLDDGNNQGVSVSDSSGDILGGVLLQLKLGFTAD